MIENRDEFDLPDSVFDEIAKITERYPHLTTNRRQLRGLYAVC